MIVLGMLGVPATASAAVARPDLMVDAPPMGLMLSMDVWGTKSAAELRTWLERICTAHPAGTQAGAINELVVMDVADGSKSDALYEAQLAELLKYFPGATEVSGPGKASCRFPRVWVGTVNAFAGERGIYNGAMLDAGLLQRVFDRSESVARRFTEFAAKTNPTATWDWYSTHEGMLNLLTRSAGNAAGNTISAERASQLTDAYAEYLVGYADALARVIPGRSLLWSPGYDHAPSSFFGWGGGDRVMLERNLSSMFSRYAQRVSTPLVVDLQDHVGSMDWATSACGSIMLPEDAVEWYELTKRTFSGELRMNVEQFRHTYPYDSKGVGPGCVNHSLSAGYGAVISARSHFYADQGVVLGASYDLSRWSAMNHSSWGTNDLTRFTGTRAVTVAGSFAVEGTLETWDGGRVLAGVTVTLLRCDTTGGACVQPSPTSGATTGVDGFVSIPVPDTDTSGTHYWRLASAEELKTSPATPGFLPSQSDMVVTRTEESVLVAANTSAARGSATILTATLTTIEGAPIAGARVRLMSCTDSSCAESTQVGSGATSVGGVVEISSGLLDGVPAYFQFVWSGEAPGLTGATSAVVTVAGATEWSGLSADSSGAGSRVTVSGVVSVVGGGPAVGLPVRLERCTTVTCEASSVVGVGESGADGSVSVVSDAVVGASWFRLSAVDTPSFAGSASGVVYVAASAGWTGVSATPAATGASSVVRGTLVASGTGTPLAGAAVDLISCASEASCDQPVVIGSARTSAAGTVAFTTPALSAVPASLRLVFTGDAEHAAASHPVTVRAVTVWSSPTVSFADDGSFVLSGILSVRGGEPVAGVDVAAYSCDTLYPCATRTLLAAGRTATDGSTSITVSAVTARSNLYVRFGGDSEFEISASGIVIAAPASTWSVPTVATVDVGGRATVTATLAALPGRVGLGGRAVTLSACSSVTDSACAGAAVSAVTDDHGSVTFTTEDLSHTPAFFRAQWSGDTRNAGSRSSVVTVQTRTGWTDAVATPARIGESSLLSAVLTEGGGSGVSGQEVRVMQCGSASACDSSAATGLMGVTDEAGAVVVDTGELAGLPAHFQFVFDGTDGRAGAASAVVTVSAKTSFIAVGGDHIAAGAEATLSGLLTLDGTGLHPAVGREVTVRQCPSLAGDCADGAIMQTAPARLVTGQDGTVTARIGPLLSVPAYFQLVSPGGDGYEPAESTIHAVTADATISVAATPAPKGGASTVTGVLRVPEGPGIGGQEVRLVRCAGVWDCANPTLLATSTTRSDGSYTMVTGALSSVPAYIRVIFGGGDGVSPVSSPRVFISGTTGWGSVTVPDGSPGEQLPVSGTLSLLDSTGRPAGGIDGARIVLGLCDESGADCVPTATAANSALGAVALTTPPLATVPTGVELAWAGNDNYAAAVTTMTVRAKTSLIPLTVAAVDGKLSFTTTLSVPGISGVSPLAGREAMLVRCDDDACGSGGTSIGTGTVSPEGLITVIAPASTDRAAYQVRFLGEHGYAEASSSPATVIGTPSWTHVTAAAVRNGGTTTITANLGTAGQRVRGATVDLFRCTGPASARCGTYTKVQSQTTSTVGGVSFQVEGISPAPAFFFLRWAGDENYRTADSAPVIVAALTTMSNTTAIGAASVSGVLTVSGGGAVGGAGVRLVACPSPVTSSDVAPCVGGVIVGASSTTDGSGRVSVPRPTQTPYPHLQLQWAGNDLYASSASSTT